MKPDELARRVIEFRDRFGNTDLDSPHLPARFCTTCAATKHKGSTTCTENAHVACPLGLAKSSAHT